MTDLKTTLENTNYAGDYTCGVASVTATSMHKCGILADINYTGIFTPPTYQRVLDHVNLVCYFLICIFGLVGNGLVIYVVLTSTKMTKVTNMYILNLAFSDVLFLVMLPVTATTVLKKHWIFGLIMCKVYFVLCAINIFGGAFNLCVMSADRYMAVCHPIQSLKYRTPRVALCMCLLVWLLSFLVMLPVILYTTTIQHHTLEGKYSCMIEWPSDQIIPPNTAFVWYSFILGFVIPVFFISVLYILVIIRLGRVGAARKSKGNRRSRGRVTRLIFTLVTVYVVCWMPYWCFQVHGTLVAITTKDTTRVLLINGFTVLSYTNSMLNPLLYAFLSDDFRQSFLKAFNCLSQTNKSCSFRHEKIIQPCTSQTYKLHGTTKAIVEKIELSVMDHCSEESQVLTEEHVYSNVHHDKQGYLTLSEQEA